MCSSLMGVLIRLALSIIISLPTAAQTGVQFGFKSCEEIQIF